MQKRYYLRMRTALFVSCQCPRAWHLSLFCISYRRKSTRLYAQLMWWPRIRQSFISDWQLMVFLDRTIISCLTSRTSVQRWLRKLGWADTSRKICSSICTACWLAGPQCLDLFFHSLSWCGKAAEQREAKKIDPSSTHKFSNSSWLSVRSSWSSTHACIFWQSIASFLSSRRQMRKMISHSWWLMEVASFLGASVLAEVRLASDCPVEGQEESVCVREVLEAPSMEKFSKSERSSQFSSRQLMLFMLISELALQMCPSRQPKAAFSELQSLRQRFTRPLCPFSSCRISSPQYSGVPAKAVSVRWSQFSLTRTLMPKSARRKALRKLLQSKFSGLRSRCTMLSECSLASLPSSSALMLSREGSWLAKNCAEATGSQSSIRNSTQLLKQTRSQLERTTRGPTPSSEQILNRQNSRRQRRSCTCSFDSASKSYPAAPSSLNPKGRRLIANSSLFIRTPRTLPNPPAPISSLSMSSSPSSESRFRFSTCSRSRKGPKSTSQTYSRPQKWVCTTEKRQSELVSAKSPLISTNCQLLISRMLCSCRASSCSASAENRSVLQRFIASRYSASSSSYLNPLSSTSRARASPQGFLEELC